MRPAAHIQKIALLVQADGLYVLGGDQVLDHLDLVVLAALGQLGLGLAHRQLAPLDGDVFLDDLGHLGLDLGEILKGDRLLEVEVVIEAVLKIIRQRRTDGVLHARAIQPAHGLRQHVRGGVPQNLHPFLVAVGNDAQGMLTFGQPGGQINHLAIHLRRQGSTGQTG